MHIGILILLIVFNGLFAMAEIALVTARKARLQKNADNGDVASAVAIALGDNPTNFLSTIQIGITAIGILNGIVGEAAVAKPLANLFISYGCDERWSYIGSTILVVVIITYVSIVIGELVPKRIAQFHAEDVARYMARPISFLSMISRPLVYLLAKSTDAILFMLGNKELKNSDVTEEDIEAIMVEGTESGAIEKEEHAMVRNVFRLDDRQIASLMTPRSEMVYFDIDRPLEDSLQLVVESEHSRFPVCDESMHDILGVVTSQEILKQKLLNKELDIGNIELIAPVFVPESMTGMKLLEQFKESGVQMVFVVDEFGEVLGIVTMQDLLEALAGEFKPQDPEDLWAVQRDDGSWLLDGMIPLHILKEQLSIKELPEEDKGRYQTLSGLIMWLTGNVPATGESTEWDGWRFEVIDLDGNRIDKVLASRIETV